MAIEWRCEGCSEGWRKVWRKVWRVGPRGSALILVICACANASGQTSDASSNAPGTSAAATKPDPAATLETVTVTAQRRSEDAQKVPITIQSFNAQAIENLDITSSTDLGQLTPNVDIGLPSGAGAQPVITIRGIGLNDFNSNNAGPNGVYVDEVYLSAPGSQTFQVFDLDRIEVLKGPQGTLYGRNTSGGAINFISAKPSAETSADITAGYGSYNTFKVEGAFGGALAEGVNARVSFVKNDSEGYMHNAATGNSENGTNDFAVRAQLEIIASPALSILANLHGGDSDTRPNEYRHIGTLNPATGKPCSYTQAFDGSCVDAFGYGTPAGFYDGAFNRQEDFRVSNFGASLRIDYAPGPVKWTSLTAFEQNNKFQPEDTDASPNRLLEINYGVHSNTFTEELRASETLGNLNWVLGFYDLEEHLTQDQPVQAFLDFDKFYGPGSGDGIAQVAYDNNLQVTRSYALFGQGDLALTERWKATLGLRYTSESKSFDAVSSAKYQSTALNVFGPVLPLWAYGESTQSSKVSGKAALDYAASDALNTYASIATGFKSADFNGGFLSANPIEAKRQIGPVSPETVLAYEVGLKSQFFEHRVQLNVALFYNDYKEMQVFNQIPPVIPGGFDLEILTNAPRAHTEGLDFQLVAKPIENLTTTLNLGLLETRVDQWNTASGTGSSVDYTGHRLPLAPSSSLAAIAAYRIPLAGGALLDLVGDASYKSHQFFDISDDPFVSQAGYWLANARATYTFGQGQYQIAAFVRNLFNKHYLVDGINLTNPFGLVQDVVGLPRFVGINFSLHY